MFRWIFEKLVNQRGEVGDPSIEPNPAPTGADWRPHAESLRADPELAPHLDKISEKTVSDLVKSHVHLSRKLGNTVQMPDPAKAKPEEIKAFKDSVLKAGIFEGAPESADKYEKPDGFRDDLWESQHAQTFLKEVAHGTGMNQTQTKAVLDYYGKIVNEAMAATTPTDEQLAEQKKAATEAWAKQGKSYDDVMSLAVEGMAKGGFTEEDIKTAEKININGRSLLSDPWALSVFARIGEAFKDSDGLIGGGVDVADSAMAEFQPGGAKWDKLAAGDQATLAERDAIYAKKYPGLVNLS